MEWPLLKRSIFRIKEILPGASIVISTNGSLLDPAKWHFLKAQGVRVILSLDGLPRTQDLHRHSLFRKKASSIILERLKKISFDDRGRIAVNMVFTPQTISLLNENILFLSSLGFKEIDFKPDLYKSFWDARALSSLKESLYGFADMYSDLFHNTAAGPVFVVPWLRTILQGRGCRINGQICYQGLMEACDKCWIFPDARFYACDKADRLGPVRMGRFCVGDVKGGIDRQRMFLLHREMAGSVRASLEERGLDAKKMFWCPVGLDLGRGVFRESRRVAGIYVALMKLFSFSARYIVERLRGEPSFQRIYHLKFDRRQRRVL